MKIFDKKNAEKKYFHIYLIFHFFFVWKRSQIL